jgi:hypothetical protein
MAQWTWSEAEIERFEATHLIGTKAAAIVLKGDVDAAEQST